MSQIDVLSVGDVVTDAFIKLPDKNVHTYNDEDGTWLAIPFGKKVPYEESEIVEAGGNAGSASISFARLGLDSAIVSNIGDDLYGQEILAALKKEHVDTRYVHLNAKKRSNYSYILRYKEERTILDNRIQYEYLWPHIHVSDIPKWIYFSSTPKNTLPFHEELAEWMDAHEEVRLAFQPGTFQIQEGAQRLKRIYKRCDVLLLNREEAVLVGGGDEANVHDLFDKLHALGPKLVVITDGPKGTYASSNEGRFFMPIYPDPSPPVERTGAGDAFSSTFVATLIQGHDLEEALRWGPINSMSVVQHVGSHAGLLSESQIRTYLKNAPDWYHPNPM